MRQIITSLPGIFVVLAFLFVNNSHGQDSIKKVTLKVSIIDMKGGITNAYLNSVSDTGLFLSRTSSRVYSPVNPGSLTFVAGNSINSVTLRKKNQVSGGFARGAIVGGVVGVLVGVVGSGGGGDGGFDIGTGGSAIIGGVGGAALGGIIGMAFSIGSSKYEIRGNDGNYVKMRQSILSRITRKKHAAKNSAPVQGIAGVFQ